MPETIKEFWRRRWFLKFHPKHVRTNTVFALKVTPLRLLVTLLVLSLPFTGLWKLALARKLNAEQKIAQCQKQIDRLQSYNRVLSKKLRQKEQEKKRVANLAAVKSVKLHEDLKKQEKQIQQIWRAIGKKPASSRKRVSLRASRGRPTLVQIHTNYAALDREIVRKHDEIRRLRAAVTAYRKMVAERARRALLGRLPDLWPVSGSISSSFGYRCHPVTRGWCFHSGIDITAPYGTPIYSTAAGVVTYASYRGGFGNTVMISHGNGFTTLYGHCSSLNVSAGRAVHKGELIAFVGSSGTSTGCHVHYEVARGGGTVNPLSYLHRHRSDLGSLAFVR